MDMNALFLTNEDLNEYRSKDEEINVYSFKPTKISKQDIRDAHFIIYLDRETNIAKILKSKYEIDAVSLKY